MKSHGNLFHQILDPVNLAAAARRAALGKMGRPPVARYLAGLDRETERLRAELATGAYWPAPFATFRIQDPKPRTIHCAPFRDRVVHQALCFIIGPVLERRMIADTYACRVGKGTHRAAARARTLTRRFKYYLKADIRKYFESVPHDRLLDTLLPVFRERPLRDLLERLVRQAPGGREAGRGLPIGSLTSQWFANHYLSAFDHQASRAWRAGAYLRYMDDFVFFGDGKDRLWKSFSAAETWLREERGLTVKPESVRLAPSTEGLEFVGLRIFPGSWRLRRSRFLRSRKLHRAKEKAWMAGEIDDAALARSASARAGLARWFGFKNLFRTEVEV